MVISSLPNRSNILSISVFDLALSPCLEMCRYIVVTTADRKVHLLDTTSPTLEVARSFSHLLDSPILDIIAFGLRYLIVASMSGKLAVFDTVKKTVLHERTDHSKYLVKLASYRTGECYLVASAGWDAKVNLYRCETADDTIHLKKPIATLTLASVPETVMFIESPEYNMPILLLSRRDSSFLYYFEVPNLAGSGMAYLGKQNLAPHSNAWVAFTPADVQPCPTDPSLVAVGTSSTPHMKLLVVKLLVPPKQASLLNAGAIRDPNGPITQASQARGELMMQDREEAAILVNVSTMAPQTQYSTPRLTWRPDGSGIYVSSDDGLVRGIEASTGKFIAALEGHDPGSKLRCLWAGKLDLHQENALTQASTKEYLLSGGFDQKLILWSST